MPSLQNRSLITVWPRARFNLSPSLPTTICIDLDLRSDNLTTIYLFLFCLVIFSFFSTYFLNYWFNFYVRLWSRPSNTREAYYCCNQHQAKLQWRPTSYHINWSIDLCVVFWYFFNSLYCSSPKNKTVLRNFKLIIICSCFLFYVIIFSYSITKGNMLMCMLCVY